MREHSRYVNWARPLTRDLAVRALRTPAMRAIARSVANRRGCGLVLLYHRVTASGMDPSAVVPVVSRRTFGEHLDALARLGEIVPLADLLQRIGSGGIRFSITFDDDDATHLAHAVPELRARGLSATFFLSGRALHGQGPPWWRLLEAAIARDGVATTAKWLGVQATKPEELAAVCEGTALVERIERDLGTAHAVEMSRADIRTLADTGMAVGFHTVNHRPLPGLDDNSVRHAIRYGREALADAAGTDVDLFAYPHGQADRRVADLVRIEGYRAAFRSGGRAVSDRSDRFLLGRWEPGPLDVDTLCAHALLRLNLPAAVPR